VESFLPRSRPAVSSLRFVLVVIGVTLSLVTAVGGEEATGTDRLACEAKSTLASGRPDRTIFAGAASKGVRAFWCERYDALGRTVRNGPYLDFYANGRPRIRAHYVDSQLAGPVTVRNEDGSLFLRGFLEDGQWAGDFEMYHDSGARWLEARFEAGVLEGALRTRFPDGALESESHYQAGREDGLARSFYPTALGGRLRSEAYVEADQIVGPHRVLGRDGELVRSIDQNLGPAAWRRPDAESRIAEPEDSGPSPAAKRPTTDAEPALHD